MNAPETTEFHSKLLERNDSHADDLLSYRTFAAKLEKERNDADNYIRSIWRKDLLPAPMDKRLFDRLTK